MAGILGAGVQDGLLLKPIHYQWAKDLYDQAVANTWFPNEIQLAQDLPDLWRPCLISFDLRPSLAAGHSPRPILFPSTCP